MPATAAPTPAKVTEYFQTNILPILERYGATLVDFHPDAHEKAEDFQRFIVAVIQKDGDRIELDSSAFSIYPNVEWLLKRWEEVRAIVASFERTTDPFHSDIFRRFKTRWQDSRQRQYSDLAYSYVCNKLRQAGKTIHTD